MGNVLGHRAQYTNHDLISLDHIDNEILRHAYQSNLRLRQGDFINFLIEQFQSHRDPVFQRVNKVFEKRRTAFKLVDDANEMTGLLPDDLQTCPSRAKRCMQKLRWLCDDELSGCLHSFDFEAMIAVRCQFHLALFFAFIRQSIREDVRKTNDFREAKRVFITKIFEDNDGSESTRDSLLAMIDDLPFLYLPGQNRGNNDQAEAPVDASASAEQEAPIIDPMPAAPMDPPAQLPADADADGQEQEPEQNQEDHGEEMELDEGIDEMPEWDEEMPVDQEVGHEAFFMVNQMEADEDHNVEEGHMVGSVMEDDEHHKFTERGIDKLLDLAVASLQPPSKSPKKGKKGKKRKSQELDQPSKAKEDSICACKILQCMALQLSRRCIDCNAEDEEPMQRLKIFVEIVLTRAESVMVQINMQTNISNTIFDLVCIPLFYGLSALSFNVVLRDAFLAILPVMFRVLQVTDEVVMQGQQQQLFQGVFDVEPNTNENMAVESDSPMVRVIESHHPYVGKSIRMINIPGATAMALWFDHQSSLRGQDSLSIYQGAWPNGDPPASARILGPYADGPWPRVPQVVRGEVTVILNSDTQSWNSLWGYRIYAVGLCWGVPQNVEKDELSVVSDLHIAAAAATSSAVALLIRGQDVTQIESSYTQILHSYAFVEGLDEQEQVNALLPPSASPASPMRMSPELTMAAPMVNMDDAEEMILDIDPIGYEFDEDRFYNDLMSAQGSTEPLIKALDSGITQGRLHTMGGADVKSAVRGYACCLIRHLALFPTALEVLELSKNEQASSHARWHLLIEVWQLSQKLRQWIVSERHKALQAVEFEGEEPEEVSYKYFADIALSKVKLLLEMRPFLTDVGTDQPLNQCLSERTAVEVQRHRVESLLTRGDEDEELQRWKSQFAMWHEIQQLEKLQADLKSGQESSSAPVSLDDEPTQEVVVQSIMNAISSYMQLKADTKDQMRHVMKIRRQRAISRVQAFELIYQSLHGLKSPLALRMMLKVFRSMGHETAAGLPLWTMKSDPNTILASVRTWGLVRNYEFSGEGGALLQSGHYDADLRGCGFRLERYVQKAYYRTLASVLQIVEQRTMPKAVVMTAWSVLGLMHWPTKDCKLVQNLSLFEAMFNQLHQDVPLRQQVISLLCIQVVNAGFTPCIQRLASLLIQAMDKLEDAHEPYRVFLFSQLLALCKSTTSIWEQVRSDVASRVVTRALRGSPRLTRLAFRFLCKVLPHLPPQEIPFTTFGTDFVAGLLEWIGKSIAIDVPDSECIPIARRVFSEGQMRSKIHEVRSQFTNSSIDRVNAAEGVELLRCLMSTGQSHGWDTHVRARIIAALDGCGTNKIGSLAVLGGLMEDLRVGGLVKMSNRTGVVLRFRPLDCVAEVMDEKALKLILSDPLQLTPLPIIAPSADLLLGEDWGAMLKSILQLTRSDDSAMDVVEDGWTCGTCTLHNEFCIDFCDACGTPKQQVEPKKVVFRENDVEMVVSEEVSKSTDLMVQTMALGAFSEFIKDPKVVASLLKSEGQALFEPLAAAVQPVTVAPFPSMAALHVRLHKLRQLVKDQLTGNLPADRRVVVKATQAQTLKYNPLGSLAVLLPTHVEQASANGFQIEDEFVRRFSPEWEIESVVGEHTVQIANVESLARGNHVIPNSLPSFYFEVTVQKLEGLMALGFYRAGVPLSDGPGCHGSFAYASNGESYHSTSEIGVAISKGPKVNEGDTIGIGWDLKRAFIFVTLNGDRIEVEELRDGNTSPLAALESGETMSDPGKVFMEVRGQFYPMVWAQGPGKTELCINFGSSPFRFDFASTLNLAELGDIGRTEASAREVSRRTHAEDLYQMMGGGLFPLSLCILALERSNDQIEMAANWLLENGHRELERMETTLLERERRAEDERQLAEAQQALQESMGFSRLMEEIHEEEEVMKTDQTPFESVADRFDQGRNALPEHTEITVNWSVVGQNEDRASEDASIQQSYVKEGGGSGPLKLDDMFIGMMVRIHPLASNLTDLPCSYAGRCGFVRSFTVDLVEVELEEDDTARRFPVMVPISVVTRPPKYWPDPLGSLLNSEDEDFSETLSLLYATEAAAQTYLLRRTVAHCLNALHTEQCNVEIDFDNFLSLLTLLFAELGPTIGVSPSSMRMLGQFWSSSEPTHALLGSMLKLLQKFVTNDAGRMQKLVECCRNHFVEAREFEIPQTVVESEHPYGSTLDIREGIDIVGCTRILAVFDKQCELTNDALTSIQLYIDKTFDACMFRSSSDSMPSSLASTRLIINSNKCWIRFTSSTNNDKWGYKVSFYPLDLRLDDTQALKSQNINLGATLVTMMLDMGKHDNIPEFIRLLLWLARERPTYRNSAIGILVSLLHHMREQSLNEEVPWQSLFDIYCYMIQHFQLRYNSLEASTQFGFLGTAQMVGFNTFQAMHQPSFSEFPLLVELILACRQLACAADVDWTHMVHLRSQFQLKDQRASWQEAARSRLKDAFEVQEESTVVKDSVPISFLVEYYKLELVILHCRPSDKLAYLQQCVFQSNGQGLITQTDVKLEIAYAIHRPATQEILDVNFIGYPANSSIFLPVFPPYWFDRVSIVQDVFGRVRQNQSWMQELVYRSYIEEEIHHTYWPVFRGRHSLRNDFGTSSSGLVSTTLDMRPPCTISFWLYCEEDLSTGTIVKRGLSTPNIVIGLDKGVIVVTLRGEVQSKQPVPPRSWVQIDIVFSPSQVQIFMDSNNIGSKRFTQKELPCNCCPWKLGEDGVPVTIADFRVYKREMTAKDIRNRIIARDSSNAHVVSATKLEATPEITPASNASSSEMVEGWSEMPFTNAEADELFEGSASKNSAKGELQRRTKLWRETLAWDNWGGVPSADSTRVKWSNAEGDHTRELVLVDQHLIWDSDVLRACVTVTEELANGRDAELLYLPELSSLVKQKCNHAQPSHVGVSLQMVRLLNQLLASVLHCIDFSSTSTGLASCVASQRGLIFGNLKMSLFKLCLGLTEDTSHQKLRISVNRGKALRSHERGMDQDGLSSVFGQIYRQVHMADPKRLRVRGRPWSVLYEGEGGIDAGGLFRDVLSHISQELQSTRLKLFIPVPNSRGFGDNQEKWIPNPQATSTLELSMFNFVGKIIGLVIRGNHCLPLDLPSLVWRQLVEEKPDRDDLGAIDAIVHQILDSISTIREDIDEKTFQEMVPYTFTTTTADGRLVELKPGGENIKVDWSNRHEFVKLTEEYRLREFDQQIQAMRRGLQMVVPLQLVSFFSCAELERMVCGSPDVDVELLKRHTRYNGFQATDDTIKWFWEVLAALTSRERCQFLRFVWGRSRLGATLEQNMEITVLTHQEPDTMLPVAHTCFFQLDLPRYSSRDVLRQRLVYAFTEGIAIDTDHIAEAINWDG